MNDKYEAPTNQENNRIRLVGHIGSQIKYSHTYEYAYGEMNYYKFYLNTLRKTGTIDRLRIVVSEDILFNLSYDSYYPNRAIEVEGTVCSHNKEWGNKNHLIIYINADRLTLPECGVWVDDVEQSSDYNWGELEGYVTKIPRYRETPKGKHITDLLIAVNMPEQGSSYIPCIAWGSAADAAALLEVGEKIRICGRMQSRKYNKMDEDGTEEIKVAYELSVFKWKKLYESKEDKNRST